MHVCLFDIDGTLLNSGGAGQAAMEAALRSEFGAFGEVEGISTAGRTDQAIVQDLFAFYQIIADEEIRDRFLAVYLDQLPQHLAERQGLVLPGVLELLQALHAREDVLLGLLTGNYSRGARAKLAHFQLDHFFLFGGYGDQHLDRDDVAREALAALREVHDGPLDLERTWVIGDTPFDVRCGRAIGARVIAVATGTYSLEALAAAEADHLFADFSDPHALLGLLT